MFERKMSKRKRALQNMMTQLEEEVENGHVNEGAHVRLSAALKKAHDATGDGSRTRHIREYLIDQVVQVPESISSVTVSAANNLVNKPEFLERVIVERWRRSPDKGITDAWFDDLLRGVIEPGLFDTGDLHCSARHAIYLVLETSLGFARNDILLSALMRHLNRYAPKPSEVFPLGPSDRELREDDNGIDSEELPDVFGALSVNADFISWLLKPCRNGCTEHGYTYAEVERLRMFAFVYGLDRGPTSATWRCALGLRHMDDARACHRCVRNGYTFAQALALVENLPVEQLKALRPARVGPARFPEM